MGKIVATVFTQRIIALGVEPEASDGFPMGKISPPALVNTTHPWQQEAPASLAALTEGEHQAVFNAKIKSGAAGLLGLAWLVGAAVLLPDQPLAGHDKPPQRPLRVDPP